MKYEYWFAAMPFLSSRKKYTIRKQITSAEELYNIEEKHWGARFSLTEPEKEQLSIHQRNWNLERNYEQLLEKQIRFLPFFEPDFPDRLLEIGDPPYALYLKGTLPETLMKSVAIVGARANSHYGARFTLEYAGYLAMRGVQIISGLAAGIDGYAHRGALMTGGMTFAVLASGVDVCYPREHIGLYSDILERGGGILSEQLPGSKPLRYHFPQRNRIISGLSDAVLVMEAKEKSGSLITADAALEQGKDVYALPGNQDSELSKGCNRLISQGAGILLSPEELCENLGIISKNSNISCLKNEIILESDESLVYNQLSFAPSSLEHLAETVDLPIAGLTAVLISLELKGVVREVSKHHYIRAI